MANPTRKCRICERPRSEHDPDGYMPGQIGIAGHKFQPCGVTSRRKGIRGEAEVARLFRTAGFDVRGLEALGDHLASRGHIRGRSGFLLHIEVKRQERLQLPIWLRQAASEAPSGAVPVVAFRQNRSEWYACLPLPDLIGLLT